MPPNKRVPNQFPCSKCGFFRGQGGIDCEKCGHDPNTEISTPLSENRNDPLLSELKLFYLLARPVMKFIGYPIGYVTLKLVSIGTLKLGPWNNMGRIRHFTLQGISVLKKQRREKLSHTNRNCGSYRVIVLCFTAFTIGFVTR